MDSLGPFCSKVSSVERARTHGLFRLSNEWFLSICKAFLPSSLASLITNKMLQSSKHWTSLAKASMLCVTVWVLLAHSLLGSHRGVCEVPCIQGTLLSTAHIWLNYHQTTTFDWACCEYHHVVQWINNIRDIKLQHKFHLHITKPCLHPNMG